MAKACPVFHGEDLSRGYVSRVPKTLKGFPDSIIAEDEKASWKNLLGITSQLCPPRNGKETSANMGVDTDPVKNQDDAHKVGSPSVAARDGSLDIHGIDDVAIIPKGALDPVYEAKARVLNRAVRAVSSRDGLDLDTTPLTADTRF